MNNLQEIRINDEIFRREDINEAARQKLVECSEEWQLNFWQFVADWFDEGKTQIQIFTSGSTGEPKAIFHDKKSMMASAAMTCRFFNLDNTKKALLCLPVSGIGGMMMAVRAFYSGMHLYFVKPSNNPLAKFNQRVDFVSMVPYQVVSTLENSAEKFQLISSLIIGGGAISADIERKLMQHGVNAYHTFGMTETITHIALRKLGENSFVALEDVVLSVDEENRLQIKAPHLFSGSIQTNDIVNLIDSKHFVWLGRFDNAIETGGVKVIPEIIEQKIAHCFSQPFFIASLPHEKLNNQVVLVIESKEKCFNPELILPYLSKYEMPKQILYTERFEYTESGKIKRLPSLTNALENLR
jgi:o-succinylbenzoate---CoA ligase